MSKRSYSEDSIKIGDFYAKFDGKSVVVGEWDISDIEYLEFEELVLLHKYILDKIIKIQLST
ncbi:MAG: hypothetical protein ACOC1K_04095 [Nanoarchaeota archaeon]